MRSSAGCLTQADLVLPDGVGLLWAARRLGGRLPERVAGSDLIYRLCERAAARGWRIYFLGAAEGVAAAAADRLQALYPGLAVAGAYAGSPRPDEAEGLVARVRAARPDLLLVAYGAPAQDKWIAHNRLALGVPVSIGVGGAFDFVTGVAVRAPVWLPKSGAGVAAPAVAPAVAGPAYLDGGGGVPAGRFERRAGQSAGLESSHTGFSLA